MIEEADDRDEVVAALRMCRRTGRPHHFWLFDKDDRGEPRLLVNRRPAPVKREARSIKPRAKVKQTAHGRIVRGDGELLFVTDGNLPPRRAQRTLRKLAKDDVLRKIARLLKDARVVERDEFLALEAELNPELHAARLRVEAVGAAVEELRTAFRGTRGTRPLAAVARRLRAAERWLDRPAPEEAVRRATLVEQALPESAEIAWDRALQPLRNRFAVVEEQLESELDPAAVKEALEPFVFRRAQMLLLGRQRRWAEAAKRLVALQSALDAYRHPVVARRIEEAERQRAEEKARRNRPPTELSADQAEALRRLHEAGEAFRRAGSPRGAARALQRVRRAARAADSAAMDAAIGGLKRALAEAREAERERLRKSLSRARFQLAADVLLARQAVEAMLAELRSDPSLPRSVWGERTSAIERGARALVPGDLDAVEAAIKAALQADDLGEALDAVAGRAADALAELRRGRARIALDPDLEARVRTPVEATLQRIAALAEGGVP